MPRQQFVEPQLVPVPFTGGIDTKSDLHQVMIGDLIDLQNGQFTNTGQINKRFGYGQLPTSIQGGGNIANAVSIHSYNNELVLFDNINMYSYVPAVGQWLNKGPCTSVIATGRTVLTSPNNQQLNPDVAYLKGIEVYTWEDSRGGIRYSVFDSQTKAAYVNDQQVNSIGFKPKVVTFGNQFYIFYTDNSGDLLYRSISPSSLTTISNATTVTGDGYASFSYDVRVISNQLFVGYLSNHTATGEIRLFYFDSNMNQSSKVTVNNTAGQAYSSSSAFSVRRGLNNSCWIVWANGHDVRGANYSYTLVQNLASTLIDTVNSPTVTCIEVPNQTTDTIQVFYEVFNSNAFNEQVKTAHLTISGTATVDATLRSVGLASKAFSFNNQLYINVALQTTLQSTYFTYCLSNPLTTTVSFTQVAKINHMVGGGLRTNNMLSETPNNSISSQFLFANLRKGAFKSEANTQFTLLGVYSSVLDFDHSNKFNAITQSNNLMIVGGVVIGYDGISPFELGFNYYPESVTAVAGGSDGYLSTGTYNYLVTYEWPDNFGQWQRSAPSPQITVSVTANQHVTLTIPTQRLTAKTNTRSDINIVVYRTAVNGTTFNQVTSVLAPLKNNPAADTVTFTDTASDTTVGANALIYTNGGTLNNISPPNCSLITHYQNRVFLGGLDDGNLLWYSQNKFDDSNFNTTSIEFCAELTLGCDSRAGNITALGLLDDKLIIYKETAIFAVTGDGPNATGLGDIFPDPTMISSDVGCLNPNSIQIMPLGLMFQTDKGIYLLDRSLQVSYIGAKVQSFNSNIITSATLIPNANQVVFTSATGPALVYDYYYNKWVTWTNHQASDADIFEGVFCYVKTTGKVFQQDQTRFDDNGQAVSLSFTTPNFDFTNLSGYQRVFRCFLLGSYKGQHSLTVNVAYDYNPTYSETVTIPASQAQTFWGSSANWGSDSLWGGLYSIYQFRVDFKTQACTAIRLQISDSQTSNYNEGYSISALTFEVGALTGGNRLRASQTYGTK